MNLNGASKSVVIHLCVVGLATDSKILAMERAEVCGIKQNGGVPQQDFSE
jgi:hypothetical protein